MKTKVILDTDIGSDIDDAVALAYLLVNPDCELLGITTVTGEAEQRAQLASALCMAAGKDVPIYPGAVQPLLRSQLQIHAPQASTLKRWPHQSQFVQGAYLDFLRDAIRANPGEITLLTIGPLTNIALLFRFDPELPALLKSLVMMCGVFTNQLAGVGPLEWNAMLDPHATAVVYQSQVPIHRSIGLDVTCQVVMDAEEVRNRFQNGLLRTVLDFAEVWFTERPSITFHDPLAAVSIFDSQVCEFERGQVDVELNSSRVTGMTAWTPKPDGKHEVALYVKPDQFFAHYFSCFQ